MENFFFCAVSVLEAYLGPCQRSTMDLFFEKIVSDFYLITISFKKNLTMFDRVLNMPMIGCTCYDNFRNTKEDAVLSNQVLIIKQPVFNKVARLFPVAL